MRISAERKRREIDPTIALLAELGRSTARKDDLAPPHVRERIGRMHEFISHPRQLVRPGARLPKPTLVTLMKLGAKVARFVPAATNPQH